MAKAHVNEHIRYEADERCPHTIAMAVGLQGVLLILAPVVVNVAVVFRAAGQSESYLAWAVVAALVIGGITTALQAVRLGRLGAGHVIITGPGPIFIGVCITALVEGGPAMMASLVVVSSLAQFAVAAWLPLVRRIVTPVVSGTAIMLIASSVVPIALDLLDDVPEGVPASAALAIAAVTLVVATALALRGSGAWRLWSPLIGMAAGCAVAAMFGAYDFQRVVDAPRGGDSVGRVAGAGPHTSSHGLGRAGVPEGRHVRASSSVETRWTRDRVRCVRMRSGDGLMNNTHEHARSMGRRVGPSGPWR